MSENYDHMIKLAKEANIADRPVTDFMTKNIVKAHPGNRIYETIQVLRTHRISGLPVVDDQNNLKGIVTEHDLLLQASSKNLDAPIEYVKKIKHLGIHSTVKDAIILLYRYRIRRLPVLDNLQRLVGIVSRIDLLAVLADQYQKDKGKD